MTITNDGLAEAAGLLVEDVTGVTTFRALAVGTDTTSASASDTALGAEVLREASTETRTKDTVAQDTSRLEATFTFGASHAITEYGTFNDTAATSGVILNRIVDAPVNVNSGDQISLTMDIVHS